MQTHGDCYQNSNERNGALYMCTYKHTYLKNVRVLCMGVCVRVLKYTRDAILYAAYILTYSHIRRLRLPCRMRKAA